MRLGCDSIPHCTCADALPPEWILGSCAAPDLAQQPCACYIASGLDDLLDHMSLWPAGGTDTLYIGGGKQAYVTVAVHRVQAPFQASQAITQIASGSPNDQEQLGVYLNHHNPLVVIAAPDPGDSTASRLASLAAAYQLQSRNFLISEQLLDSFLYKCPPWKSFLQMPTTVQVTVPGYRHTDRHVCANHAALLSPLRVFLADNPSFNSSPLQLSSQVSQCLSDGVSLLRTCLHLMTTASADSQSSQHQSAFPSAAVGPGPLHADEPLPAPSEEQWRKCPGCRGRQARYDDRHTRVRGQCKFPDDVPHTWTCPGCKYHRPLTHPSHSFGPDCKHAIVEGREGARRKGRHPRAPSRPASDAPGADLQAQLPGGGDLGEAEEAEADRHQQQSAPSSSAAHPPGRPELEVTDPVSAEELADILRSPPGIHLPQAPAEDDEMLPSPVPVGEQSSAAEPDPSASRGPRSRRAFKEAGSGPENPADWTRYDISRSLKVLRTGSERAVLVELRKLHLRLWHAGRQSMTAILRAAGLSNKVLDLIPNVIETCRECRKWQSPKPNTQHSLSVSMAFNEHLEVDLLFYREHIIFHGLDRATRWHSATAVASKEGEVLFEALSTCWLNTFGPPKFLICDGEGGLWRPEIMDRIRRMGTEPKLRAPEQHARYVERRGAILRGTLHLIEEQLEREELVYPFAATLAEAVFAGNTCTHVGGSTPFQAVFGRQPAFLPPLDAPDLPNLDESSERGELQRARVRAAALQAMIQATTMAKLTRASRTRTSHPTEHLYHDGDLIDIHRKPSSKDASGWWGPHRVVRVEPGQVVVNIKGVDRTYRAQDVRHSLLVFLTVGASSGRTECLALIEQELQRISPGQSQLFGFAASPTGQWELTAATQKRPQVLHALEHLFSNVWRLDECSGARLARGAKSLSAVPGASHSTILWWMHSTEQDLQVLSLDGTKVDLSDLFGKDYPRVMVIQAIHTAEHEVTLAEAAENAAEETHESLSEDFVPDADCERESAPSVHTPHGPLSVIAEEPEDVAYAALLETAPGLSEAAREALRIFFQLDKVETLEQSSEPSYDTRNTLYMPPVELEPVEDVYIQHHQLGINPSQYARLNEHDESGNGFTELWFTREFSKVIGDDSLLKPAETYVLRMYASGFRNAVIQRESDLLTEQELRRHDEAVKAAILEELKIWEGYQCFERTPRKGAHNVMDSKFVAKWKVLKDASGADKRIIRMRLALRGFKDLQAHELESHAATASRQSQRCLCSEAALHPTWKFIALDINKAFLQGLTYREIHELTGEDERDVCFTLPPGSGALLRQLPGYEDFDERTEVLRCIKPGTGCKDAPRAFALKLAKYTRHPKIGLTPTLYDSELEVKLKDGRIVLMLAKHVDDLKVAGEPHEVDALVTHLESGFGKLTFSENCFTNCGLRHTRLPDGSIEMDQDEYISAMKAIRHPELTGRNSNEPCSEAVKGLYQSLLGAVAYALMSQAWASVFVIALQRRTSNPLNLHVRRLNLLLAALQKQKCKLRFPNMKCSRHLVAYSDASFDKESDSKGYGMRGTAVLRLGVRDGKSVCHLLEAQSQSLRLVTRSTFSSETLAAVGTVDNLVPWLYTLHEVQTGPLTSDEARSLREHGGFSMESELVVDAMNLYHALTAISPKPPAEKTLYSHLAWLRDLMCRHIPNVVTWCDTRDMIADALTKGKVSRDALLEAMKGMYSQVHEAKRYRKPVPTASSSSSKEERSEQGTA